MRTLIEFECNDCNGWFIVNFNFEWEGQFLFVCPQCGREHPRNIIKGVISEPRFEIRTIRGKAVPFNIDRYGSAERQGERIVVMKSAYSKTPRLEKVVEPGGTRLLAERRLELIAEREQA